MGSAMLLLLSAIFSGLITSSYQQTNSAPFFVTEENGQKVDGNLSERLTKQGILENTAIGTIVGTLSCKDNDGDPVVGYGVQSQTLGVNEKTGAVTVKQLLDRESYLKEVENNPTGENARQLTQVFSCWDGRGKTAAAEVYITVTDVNDNAPEFLSDNYSTEVSESVAAGRTILTGISIKDEDAAYNAKMTVSCSSSDVGSHPTCDIFTVETVCTGPGTYSSSIVLQKQLDFESRIYYNMTVKAVDLGTPALTSSVHVSISVIDAQDTVPGFVNVPLTIFVKENVPQNTSAELKIGAFDGDWGNPRPVKIKMKNDTLGLFRLGPSLPDPDDSSIFRAAVIVNAPIDREALLGTYWFEVEAVELDNGTETNSRQDAFVQVDILDENDNIPSFSKSTYNVTLAEIDSIAQGSVQIPNLDMKVTDRDDDRINAKYTVLIVYQSQNTTKIVPDGEVSGNATVKLITNAKLLDYDKPNLRFQRIVLEARESDANPRTSTATVNIFLRDVNDNSPQFTSSHYLYTLPENAPVGTSIATIKAVDKDEGENGNVKYNLERTGNDQFLINQTTGSLTLIKALDYETLKEFQMLVNAKDGGNPARETSEILTIIVSNINDEPPIAERAVYQTYAKPTSLTLLPAVVVKATDNEDSSGVITYRIIAGNTPNNAFRVDSITGSLTLDSYIDFDEAPSNGRFEVVIQASDNESPPQYVNMTVKVDQLDENINSPTFTMESYSVDISEMAQPGTSVVNVIATDADRGRNGKFLYRIQSGGSGGFDISNTSGLITVSNEAEFDYDHARNYSMVVLAIDSGFPPRTGSTIVIVNLLDANNKAPKFAQPLYVTSISDATPNSSSVLDISASDTDSTSKLQYSIPTSTITAIDNEFNSIPTQLFDFRYAFAVDPILGRIRTSSTLQRDLAAVISFRVLVRDLNADGTLRQTDETTVVVSIIGSTVYFKPPIYYFSVTEGKQENYVVTTVAAHDPACGNCLLHDYMEVENSDPKNYLKVDRISGQVSLTKALDYGGGDRRLSIDIRARASTNRTARTRVIVEIRDDNDNGPLFALP
ncbi:cadherin-87A-like isoform X2 [Haliotis asinina]|uniref:cadherin-87A-like isoform X2 n=1 Tax=Haliotis asinina TaxID=109174 RepID=UPI003531D33F